jgi:hypothetical protein
MSVDYPLKQELIASAQETIDWPTCLATAQSLNSKSKSESESTADLSHSFKFKSIFCLTKFGRSLVYGRHLISKVMLPMSS